MIEHGDVRALFQQRAHAPQLGVDALAPAGDGPLVQAAHQRALRVLAAEHERVGYEDTDLGNTYLGFNIFPARVSDKHRDLQRHKIVVNYIFTNGDDEGATNPWGGIGGYMDDTFGVQWQYKY